MEFETRSEERERDDWINASDEEEKERREERASSCPNSRVVKQRVRSSFRILSIELNEEKRRRREDVERVGKE